MVTCVLSEEDSTSGRNNGQLVDSWSRQENFVSIQVNLREQVSRCALGQVWPGCTCLAQARSTVDRLGPELLAGKKHGRICRAP